MSQQSNVGPTPAEMSQLVEQIIAGARLQDLPAGDLEYLRQNLSAQMNRRLGLLLVESMNEEAREEYAGLLVDSLIPDTEKLRELLEKHVPDYQEKIKTGLADFMEQAVASLSQSK